MLTVHNVMAALHETIRNRVNEDEVTLTWFLIGNGSNNKGTSEANTRAQEAVALALMLFKRSIEEALPVGTFRGGRQLDLAFHKPWEDNGDRLHANADKTLPSFSS